MESGNNSFFNAAYNYNTYLRWLNTQPTAPMVIQSCYNTSGGANQGDSLSTINAITTINLNPERDS